MPRQNRVDPFGRIVAHHERGTLMGNRGHLHDEHGRIVRTSDRIAWISCLTQFQGRRRQIMAPGHYTELFFLDEATAVAAGHRPCGRCRPDQLNAFKRGWAAAHGLARLPFVDVIDRQLAQERGSRPVDERACDELPNGTMISLPGSDGVWLWQEGRCHRWSFGGYGPAEPPPARAMVPVTPPSMLAVLRAGYKPMIRTAACGGG